MFPVPSLDDSTGNLCNDWQKRLGETDWSNASLNIIIITLKDLHWPRHGSHRGLSAVDGLRAPSMDRRSSRRDGGVFLRLKTWPSSNDEMMTIGQNIT